MESNNNKKVVIAAVVIVAIALLGVGASAIMKEGKENEGTSTVRTTSSTTPSNQSSSVAPANSNATYKDGTYTASSDYQSPGGVESISVTVTVKDGSVSSSDVTQEANNRDSREYQADFKNNYKTSVVGKKLSEIMLSTVSGSSLTSEGFNEALQTIRTQASSQT